MKTTKKRHPIENKKQLFIFFICLPNYCNQLPFEERNKMSSKEFHAHWNYDESYGLTMIEPTKYIAFNNQAPVVELLVAFGISSPILNRVARGGILKPIPADFGAGRRTTTWTSQSQGTCRDEEAHTAIFTLALGGDRFSVPRHHQRYLLHIPQKIISDSENLIMGGNWIYDPKCFSCKS